MLTYKKRIPPLLFCALTVLSFPLFCAEIQPQATHSSPSKIAPVQKKLSQEKIDKLNRLQEAVKQGDKTAQLELGLVYVNGYDLPQDFDKAAHWLIEAAEQGDYHAASSFLMLLVREPTLSPTTKRKIEVWLKAQGDRLPQLDFTPPAYPHP
jgi:Sel1 repeat